MKKFVGLVVVLAALVLGGYYAMGVATEHTLRKNLAVVSSQSNGLAVDIAEYNRGWFTSSTILNWKLHLPERVTKTADGQSQTLPAQDFQLKMPVTIFHGPVIFADDGVHFGLGYGRTVLTLPPEYSDKFKQKFSADSTQPQLDLSLFVNYFNNSQVDMSVPEFKVTAKEGAHFEWLGLDSKTNVSSSGDKIDGTFDINGVQASKDDMTVVIGQVDADFNLHKTESDNYIGDAGISLPSVVVKNKDQNLFEISAFKANSSSDVQNGLFSSHFQTSIDKVVANGKTYGPGNLEMAIRNLDASVWEQINDLINKMQQGTDAEKQQALLALLPELPKLFSKGAEFEIADLSFAMPEGAVEGNLALSLPPGEFSNPFEMVQKIKGNGKVKVPAAVLKQVLEASNSQRLANQAAQQATPAVQPVADGDAATATQPATVPAPVVTPDIAQQASAQTTQQMANLLQSGLFVQQGSDYAIELSFEQGKLSVNGKPFTPTMLKF